jgi:hypothetical protein
MMTNGFFMHSAANTSAERAIPIGIPPDNTCSNIYIDNQWRNALVGRAQTKESKLTMVKTTRSKKKDLNNGWPPAKQ